MLSRVSGLVRDLHRRRVFRAAALYLVTAWVVLEVSATVFPIMGLPEWSERLVLGLLVAGFPLALVLSWAFDLGPRGLERTPGPAADAPAAAACPPGPAAEIPLAAGPPPANSIA